MALGSFSSLFLVLHAFVFRCCRLLYLWACWFCFMFTHVRHSFPSLIDKQLSRKATLMFQGPVVQKTISTNPGLKFNRLFILVCSAWQLKLKLSKEKYFIVSMISEQKFSNIFVYIFIILSTKFSLILD